MQCWSRAVLVLPSGWEYTRRVTLGLLLTALGLGLRHGVDWDHIAAIADLTGTARSRGRGIALSMLYAVGHGAVVFVLGVGAIVFGLAIPDGLDAWMGRVVGATLVLLGVWILFELVRKGRDFRLQSRWMLVLGGTFAGLRRVSGSSGERRIEVEHDHGHEHSADGGPSPVEPAEHEATEHDHVHSGNGRAGHRHSHRHEALLPGAVNDRRENSVAAGIGMLHGVGIESPTQIAIFVASSAAVGFTAGIALLAAWVIGLIVANLGLAAVASAGLLNPDRSFAVYGTLAVVVGLLSIGLGVAYLSGAEIAGF